MVGISIKQKINQKINKNNLLNLKHFIHNIKDLKVNQLKHKIMKTFITILNMTTVLKIIY